MSSDLNPLDSLVVIPSFRSRQVKPNFQTMLCPTSLMNACTNESGENPNESN